MSTETIQTPVVFEIELWAGDQRLTRWSGGRVVEDAEGFVRDLRVVLRAQGEGLAIAKTVRLGDDE